jgi:hypothetical protein
MKIKGIIFLLLIGIICLDCRSKSAIDKNRVLVFERETLVQTKPCRSPYFFPIYPRTGKYQFDRFTSIKSEIELRGFSNREDKVSLTVDLYWALNSGNLLFLNSLENELFLLDIESGQYTTFYPPVDTPATIDFIWTDPHDDLYLGIRKTIKGNPNDIQIAKYRIAGDDLVNSGPYYPMAFQKYSFNLRIAPDGNIYALGWGSCRESAWGCGLFNDSGRFIDCTCAEGKTSGGQLFYYREDLPFFMEGISLPSFDKDKLLKQKIQRFDFPFYNFKSTFDDIVVTYRHIMYLVRADSLDSAYVDKPAVIVLDAATGHSIELDLYSDLNTKYKYFSVSDISINYKSEIYALFVYFDTPRQITGDELIVLYRWRLKENIKANAAAKEITN